MQYYSILMCRFQTKPQKLGLIKVNMKLKPKGFIAKSKELQNRYQWHKIVSSSAWKWFVDQSQVSDKLSAKNNRGRLLHDCPIIIRCDITTVISF